MSLAGGVLTAVPALPHAAESAVRIVLRAGDASVRAVLRAADTVSVLSLARSDDAPPLTTPRDPAREAARRELTTGSKPG